MPSASVRRSARARAASSRTRVSWTQWSCGLGWCSPMQTASAAASSRRRSSRAISWPPRARSTRYGSAAASTPRTSPGEVAPGVDAPPHAAEPAIKESASAQARTGRSTCRTYHVALFSFALPNAVRELLSLTEDLPGTGGILKARPEDFEVEEIPAYAPTGEGDHVLAWVEKRDRNT